MTGLVDEDDADPGTVDDDEVDDRGEFPGADAVRWRAPREEVAREVGRRDVAEPGRSTAGESGGNR